MRLAVSCEGERLTDPVDPRFGRARHFVVFDTETEEVTVIDNAEQVEAVQGAGVQAAHRLVAERVDAVLTRRVIREGESECVSRWPAARAERERRRWR